ncbi:MAG TPA: DegT/DnrJ/EryC1/StrS family aminotransferase [Candidatus Acidoferrales bacterium]|nr:DegT/DnrJ/EryC1/StrS family aminotransferase [Candidatus Acidoferrales bacterium]
MSEKIPMSAPDLDEQDIAAVVEVLHSGRLSLGPKIEEFEGAICQYIGVRHAVAVSSGTAALHLIVKALELGPGDEVLVPSFTFSASVNVLLYEGVTPVFCDIENETYNVDPLQLEEKITPRTKAILVVDVFGHPVEWDVISRVAKQYNLRVIDDSCEALGAEYDGCKVGQFGDAAAFAFYANKQITTGEGGMLVTNNPEIARIARSLRNQGRGEMGSWLEHERLGFNYRMSEMCAALGSSQMRRIESFLAQRQQVADLYNRRLSGFPQLRTPVVDPRVRMSWFVYVITLDEEVDRDAVVKELGRRQIPSRCYFLPIHLQKYILGRTDCRIGELPVTESVARRTLALPFHNRLAASQVDEVASALQEAVEGVQTKC